MKGNVSLSKTQESDFNEEVYLLFVIYLLTYPLSVNINNHKAGCD